MPSLYTLASGALASSQDTNQLVLTLTGQQNTPVSIKNTDPIAYTLQLQNTDAAGKTLLLYGPDGTTVILRSQANGVVASPDGTAAAPIVTTTHAQTLTNKTFTAPTLTSPHMTGPVVDSGGLTVTAGGLTVTAAPLIVGTAVAATGQIRLPPNVNISWRNAGGTADNSITFGTGVNDAFSVQSSLATAIGNGANTNMQSPLLGTGGGPTSPTVVLRWWNVTVNGSIFWIPLFA